MRKARRSQCGDMAAAMESSLPTNTKIRLVNRVSEAWILYLSKPHDGTKDDRNARGCGGRIKSGTRTAEPKISLYSPKSRSGERTYTR